MSQSDSLSDSLPVFTKRLRIAKAAAHALKATATASLPLEMRIKSRARIALDGGGEAGFTLNRGEILRDGDFIATDDSRQILRIVAAPEAVSTVRCADALLLTRCAYHLGNRHVPLQIGEGFVRYQHDHVLDDMVRQMGLEVVAEEAPFEPEAGAYQSSPHSHGPGHGHGHSDTHDHGHGHEHGHGHGECHHH
ncbi:urease accessory protein UreE [Corticibacter populi]|uniref:Urease accessory protein UreE n=1 Tax=Corticibacter populi TaxID=1550736 RepID=A0A3M6R0C1_9BURK|nr:urease accessory protein UreE [Corticibacter populi]RZS36053.1 urease accessory protein [Corticibacter populi]